MAGQLDGPLTIYDAVSFPQRGLDNELVQRRAHQVGRVLKGFLHMLRHPGRDSAPFVRSSRHELSESVGELGTPGTL